MGIRKYVAALIVLALAVGATFAFLIVKATGKKTVYPVEAVERRTIESKVLASGSIIPEKEVEVKSSLSGVVDEIFAVPGDPIKKGAPLLSIRVVPNSLDLNSSESALEKASIRLKNAEAELERSESLFDAKIIAEVEYKKSVTSYDLALEDYKEAKNRIMLIKEGISSGKEAINNIILSPISGTVLDILVKEGAPVQESGGYSAGTTVAAIADMRSLLFEGEIDEARIDSLKKGMEANIKLAAIEDVTIPGTLAFLSPRGISSSGSVKFKLRVALHPTDDLFLRAGYSASAEIILSRADGSLCVQERDLIMEDGKYYVEVEKGRQEFVKTEVSVGISDGLYTEITGGLSEGDRVKGQRGPESM